MNMKTAPLLRRFICRLALALLGWSCASTVSLVHADEVRYTFAELGADWTKPAFDAGDWKTAPDLPALTQRWQETSEPALWVRLTKDLLFEQINNSYFRVVHDGPVEIFVNGKSKEHNDKPAPQGRDYPISPKREEVIGRNVFGLHFTAGKGARDIRVEHVVGEWVPVEERIVRSNPIIREPTRDAQVCLGPDGRYYLAATSGERDFFFGPKYWLQNQGVMLRRSEDLVVWENLGYVWNFERDGTWNRDTGTIAGRGPARGIFAPEISYFNHQFWLPYSVNHTTPKHSFGIGLLHADKPEGPWQEVSPEQPMSEGFDPSLFRDDDGKVYLLRNGCLIARLKDDLSGLAEPFRALVPSNFPRVGYEGPCMFKYKGRYYLAAAEWFVHRDGPKSSEVTDNPVSTEHESYDVAVASADHINGPYGPRHLAIRYGGHNGFFPGKDGGLRATVWNIPDSDHQVTIARVEITPEGVLRPVLEDCLPPTPAGR